MLLKLCDLPIKNINITKDIINFKLSEHCSVTINLIELVRDIKIKQILNGNRCWWILI